VDGETPTSAPILAELGPGALADLKRVLEAPQTYRDALLRQFIPRPQLADLATLIAMANSDAHKKTSQAGCRSVMMRLCGLRRLL
jgi:hypothetical protein